MGTSTSQPSPNRPTWNSVKRLLRDEAVPVARVLNEVWSVACRDGDMPILDQLSSPVMYELARISSEAHSVNDAARLATRTIAKSKANSIVVDLAKRALMGSIQSHGDRLQAFATAVFTEVGGYITARDISGMVGSSPRFKDTSSSIDFKASLKSMTKEIVMRHAAPLDSLQAWSGFVRKVASALSGGRV